MESSQPSRAIRKNKRLAMIFVLLTLGIDAIGIGIIIPVMPSLLLEVGGGELAEAAVWGGALATVFAVMQLICSPTVGNLSDRYGRRPVLLVSLFFMAVDYLILGMAHALWLLVVGRIIGGITASTQATVAAFIADISQPEEKAKNFGLMGAAFGIGFVLGPIFGAVLAEFGTRAPFFGAAAFSAANLLLGIFVLPETVTDEIRRPFNWKRANPLGGLYHIGKLPGLGILLVVLFIFQVSINVYPAIWSFYTLESFGWGPRMIGISVAIYGVAFAIAQGWFIRVVLKYLSEHQTFVFGMAFELVGLLGFAFATQAWMIFVITPISSIGAVAFPALQGIMARTAANNQQGELQGVIASMNSLALIVSPLVMTWVFYAFVQVGSFVYFPGAPFLLSFALAAVALALFVTGTRNHASKVKGMQAE